MEEEKKAAGSEVICTLSTSLLGGQFVVQFAIPKDASVAEKNNTLDEMRKIVERQMAFQQIQDDEMQLAVLHQQAQSCMERISNIEDVAKMTYSINGGGKRGPVKLTDAQEKGMHNNQVQLADIRKHIVARQHNLEKARELISGQRA